MLNNYFSKIIHTLFSYVLLELSSCIKFSYIFGSKQLFFSGINCTGPLLGHYKGLGAFILLVLRKRLFSTQKVLNLAYTSGGGLFNPLIYHIPTFIASAYWFSSNKFIRLVLPVICMVIFILHPIGYEAFVYSWFWFIPLVVHFLPYRTPFLEALGTTFLAHAIGTVLTLYVRPMPAEYWIALIPVVVVERLLFASGMTLIYYGASWVTKIFVDINPLSKISRIFSSVKA
jgi:hypothetical protein